MSASIDMNRPEVRRMLGDVPRGSEATRSLMHVAGDAEEGVTSAINLDIGKHEVLVYSPKGDIQLLTVDVYQVAGEPLKVHLLCPRCHNHLQIMGDKKAIEFDLRASNRQNYNIRSLGGLSPAMQHASVLGDLSIEEFECTWELDGTKKVSLFSGGNLCRFRAAIDHNLLRSGS